MILERRLSKPPADIAATVAKESKRADSLISAGRLKIGEEKSKDLSEFVAKKIDEWKKSTSKMRRKLMEWNDLYEGVVEKTNFPFEGASNITLHRAASDARNFRSTFNATVFQDPDIFIARPRQDSKLGPEDVERLESAINRTFSDECNGLRTLKGSVTPCYRDGTVIISGSWDRRVETLFDFRTYDLAKDFSDDYPDAESAGLDEQGYSALLDEFLADPELELRVSFEYDAAVKDGPIYETIPLANFIFGPVYAERISEMEIYGSRYFLSKAAVKGRARAGKFSQTAVNSMFETGNSERPDEWQRSRDIAEGLSSPSQGEDVPVELADVVVKYDLNGDGNTEKYFISFAVEKKKILSLRRYELRRGIDFCVPFRMIAREGRFLGTSLLGSCQDLYQLLDGIHNHRNNVRMLVAAPILIGNTKYKDELDFGRLENVIRPGVTWWSDDINNAVKQVQISNLDQPGNSLDEEQIINRYLELSVGTTQALSGKQTPDDPRAPMGKTLALINQANKRIDDYIDEFRLSIPELAELHCALLSQYGGKEAVKTVINRGGRPEKVSIASEFLAQSKVGWDFPKRSVAFLPEFVMRRQSALMNVYMGLLPLLQSGNAIAIEMWNRIIIASGEPDSSKLLWTQESQAMQQMQPQTQKIIPHPASHHPASVAAQQKQQRGLIGQE